MLASGLGFIAFKRAPNPQAYQNLNEILELGPRVPTSLALWRGQYGFSVLTPESSLRDKFNILSSLGGRGLLSTVWWLAQKCSGTRVMTKVELGISSIEGMSSSSFARVEMRCWGLRVQGSKRPPHCPIAHVARDDANFTLGNKLGPASFIVLGEGGLGSLGCRDWLACGGCVYGWGLAAWAMVVGWLCEW